MKDINTEESQKDSSLIENGTLKNPSKKKNKKAESQRIMNGDAVNGSKEEDVEQAPAAKRIKGASIFEYFKELTSDKEEQRVNATFQLIQHIKRITDDEKRKKELKYALKRSVRGCGASSHVSRAGFFTCLVSVLKEFEADIQKSDVKSIFDIMNKELHVGATVANKEDADAIVGKILVCDAIVRSNGAYDIESFKEICNTLIQSSRQRSYLSSLAYAVFNGLFEKVTEKEFSNDIWPILQTELTRPWPKQTMNTIHCLIEISRKFPNSVNKKYMEAHFGEAQLLNTNSYDHLFRIFWQNSNTQILTHPAFEAFGAYLATCKNLCNFWKNCVDPKLQTPNKLIELETLKIFTDILQNINVENRKSASIIVELLSPNFIHMFVEGLKSHKQKSDETLKAFYDDFLDALCNCFTKLPSQCDAEKVQIIRSLILPPGIFNIEKYTESRIIHKMVNTLGVGGLQEIFELYKGIFLGTLPKDTKNTNEAWLHLERVNAGYMVQHILLHKALMPSELHAWRAEQMQLLFACGIMHVQITSAASFNVCKKDSAGQLDQEFGEQCKNMFFASLQNKFANLESEKKLLASIVQFCNKYMRKENAVDYFRLERRDEALTNAWRSMFAAVAISDNDNQANECRKADKNNKLKLVFQVLLLNMGLQLFREPEMAVPAIDDLVKCMEKANTTFSKKKQGKTQNQDENSEPEWIEVIVDLFLHLLSHNANALRSCVNSLFPQLCDNISLNAIHQILSMLDMKDGSNPLSIQGQETDDEGSEDEDSEAESNERASSDEAENAKDSDESEDSDENDDADSDDEDDDDEEDVTATDKLRNAISQALMKNNASISGGDDDDMASVDLNDISEEEGKRLDEALAQAFKAMRKSDGAKAENKKSKSYRARRTTVMHFRIRVLDLLDIYIQQQKQLPLLIVVEIMLSVYSMIEHCVGDDLMQLRQKVEKLLHKLFALKTYTNDVGDLAINDDNIIDYINQIVEKKANVLIFDLANRLRNRCIVFLLQANNRLYETKSQGNYAVPEKIVKKLMEYQTDFVQLRNPIVNITLLSEIYNLPFPYVWRLATALAQNGVTVQTRTFRRIQIYEILRVLYKNTKLQKLDSEDTRKNFKKIEKSVLSHLEHLGSCSNNASDEVKLSSKELQTLLELFLDMHRAHYRLGVGSLLLTPQVFEIVQKIRRKTRLESTMLHVYQRFCNVFKLPVIRNNETVAASNSTALSDLQDEQLENYPSKRKRLSSVGHSNHIESLSNGKTVEQKTSMKEKKARKEQRMLAASKGLKNDFAFTNSKDDSRNNGIEVH